MTINVNVTPNSVHLTGDTHFAHHFGDVASVTPICLPGNGHTPHVDVRFSGSVRLEFSPETLAELCRRGVEALAMLPFIPDVHDAILDGGDS